MYGADVSAFFQLGHCTNFPGFCNLFSKPLFFRHKKIFFPELIQRRSRSKHRTCYVKKGVLKNVGNFRGKHEWLESLFKKITCLQTSNFIKKRLQHRCFSVKFAEFLRISILKNIWEGLFLTVLKTSKKTYEVVFFYM